MNGIVGVGCTGHGKGLYLWGKDDRPAYHAVASTDRRGVEYVEKWYADGTARQAEALSLQPVGESQPVAILAWIKEHHPEVFQNIRWIFEAKDFIRFMLTGKATAEVTELSPKQLPEIRGCLSEHRFAAACLILMRVRLLWISVHPIGFV